MSFQSEGYVGGPLVLDGTRLRVYKAGSNASFRYLACSAPIASAVWAGNALQVVMQDGWTRLYSGFATYKQIPPPATFRRKHKQ